MNWLDKLTWFHGKLSDYNSVWFPFVFLKPKPREMIGPARRLSMILCFSLYGAGIYPLKQYLWNEPVNNYLWAAFGLKCLGFFAIWFRLVTVPLWNRRARLLLAQDDAN